MYFNEALGFDSIEEMLKSGEASTPPRHDMGVYFVRDELVWAQYRASSVEAVTSKILYPKDSLGVDIADEGRWYIFAGISLEEHSGLFGDDCHAPIVKGFTGDPASFTPSVNGAIYVATDTNLLYRSTGTDVGNLVAIGGSGGGGSILKGAQTPYYELGRFPDNIPGTCELYCQYSPAAYGSPAVYKFWMGLDPTGAEGEGGWVGIDGFF